MVVARLAALPNVRYPASSKPADTTQGPSGSRDTTAVAKHPTDGTQSAVGLDSINEDDEETISEVDSAELSGLRKSASGGGGGTESAVGSSVSGRHLSDKDVDVNKTDHSAETEARTGGRVQFQPRESYSSGGAGWRSVSIATTHLTR